MKVNDRHVSFYYENDDDYGKIEIDPKKTALLIIDMQHVFITRPVIENPTEAQKKEAERWEQFYKAIDETVVPNNKKLLDYFRAHEMDVMPGDPLADIVPELAPLPDEIVFTKTTDSALTGTNLRLTLFNMGIDTVVVTGVLTDQCVSGTVRSLADESFKVWLIEDACRAATEKIQENELEILNNIYCHVITTDELLEALN